VVILTPALKVLRAASDAATEQEHTMARQLALGASVSPSDPAEVLSMLSWLQEAEPWPATKEAVKYVTSIRLRLQTCF